MLAIDLHPGDIFSELAVGARDRRTSANLRTRYQQGQAEYFRTDAFEFRTVHAWRSIVITARGVLSVGELLIRGARTPTGRSGLRPTALAVAGLEGAAVSTVDHSSMTSPVATHHASALVPETPRLRLWGWPVTRPSLGCTLVLCAIVLFCRRPDSVHNPQFWAEDGRVFFCQAHELGIRSLLIPSAGYLHTVLRLVAWLATFFDVGLEPALYVMGAVVLTRYVGRTEVKAGAFTRDPSADEAVALVTLSPGNYSLVGSPQNPSDTGELLLEIHEVEPAPVPQVAHE